MSFTVYNKRNDVLTDAEYLQMAEEFATNNNIFHGIYDEGNRYRVDLYFNKTVIDDIDGWLKLLNASDIHTISVLPTGICSSFYRMKKTECHPERSEGSENLA